MALASAADVEGRVSVGAMEHAAPNFVGVEGRVSSRLDVTLSERTTFRLDGRLAGMAAEETAGLGSTRINRLGVRYEHGGATVDVGRFEVSGGGWRLADGVQVLHDVHGGLRAGAWIGAVPELATSAPTARLGGGPLLDWDGEHAHIDVLGEVVVGADGFDHASVASSGWVERGRVDLSWRVDLQATDVVLPVNAGAVLRFRPVDALRLEALYDAYTSPTWLWGDKLDPNVRRFFVRTTVPDLVVDRSINHLVGGKVRVQQTAGAGVVFGQVGGRVRYHPTSLAASASLDVGYETDVFTLTGRQAFVSWDGLGTSQTSLTAYTYLGNRWAFDSSVQVDVPLDGAPPSVYADTFLDWMAARNVVVSGGVALDWSRAGGSPWEVGQGAYLRATWLFR